MIYFITFYFIYIIFIFSTILLFFLLFLILRLFIPIVSVWNQCYILMCYHASLPNVGSLKLTTVEGHTYTPKMANCKQS